MERRTYTLQELLDKLGLEYDERRSKMDCFNCGKRKKLNLDFQNNYWRCPACDASGGVLHLFARIQLGMELDEGSSKSTKIHVAKELDKYMGGDYPAQAKACTPKEPPPEIPVASDERLDRAYRAMLEIPTLALSDKHKADLIRRGLTEEAIERNGYRTMPADMSAGKDMEQLYADHGGEMRRNNELSWISKSQILFGLMIARTLQSKGIDLHGVPGFFRFGQLWCYWSIPGMMIPTRNMDGQIVIWQLRRDKRRKKSDAKYITVAARFLPGHVTEGVSRCHFPLSNSAEEGTDSPVVFTEGPLKADVASFLWKTPTIFAAIPGISTTTDLLSYCNRFKATGRTAVMNAMDMDRFTNPHVRKGVQAMVAKLEKQGIQVNDMCWDKTYAVHLLLIFKQVARNRNITYTPSGENVFQQLDAVAEALNNAGIDLCSVVDEKGERRDNYWKPETKGIDDYLLSIR